MTLYIWSALYEIPEAITRFDWYQGLGVPTFIVDGVLWSEGGWAEGSTFERYLPLVEERLLEPSPLVMTADYSVAAGQVDLSVEVTAEETIRGQNRLDFFVCQEGLGGQSNMVVAMLPSEPLAVSEPGQTMTVQRQFALDPEWTQYWLRIVVFAQCLSSKEVLQSALAVSQTTATPFEDGAVVSAPRAWPNPFGSSTTIGFSLPRAGRTRLDVFDLDGRLVRTLVCAPLEAGVHQAVWRGDDGAGRRAGAGTYFYRLQLDDEPPRTGRVVLLR